MKSFLIGLFVLLLAGCEECEKNYSIVGTVRDKAGEPIEGVSILFAANPQSVSGKTDSVGEYSIPYKTRAHLAGMQLRFEKTNFVTIDVDAYTVQEAGPDQCGKVTLKRDVVFEQKKPDPKKGGR